MVDEIKDLKRCYPYANLRILTLSENILHEMGLDSSKETKIMQLLAFACDKHYQIGYNSKNNA